jgi:two-component system sensor histidine kinase and response regulator WspE
MQLPLTLSVVRALLVKIGGEPYAFPLARIDRTLKIHRDQIETMEGRQYFTFGNQHIGMLSASQVLELSEPVQHQDELPIVVLGERLDRYGLVVDCFLGERNLVVQTLDTRLGKIRDIGAAAILEDGAPCLIMDVDDLIRSIDILIAGGRLDRLEANDAGSHHHHGKRILVVDDSITVREVERNMLASRGYAVDVAVDGMDGWNAVRTGQYDLVISDVDMPRMNGFEFVAHIKEDPALKSTPVMIVSYKDREEDRARGLEVGADYYLTKGSFHDETLLDAVLDLIGEA